MSRPLVSVVIPVFNGEAFLAEAIESARSQTYKPIELVVVDDGSSDESTSIASRTDVQVIRQSHRGVSAACNAGLAAARGELITFLDADDVWPPERIALQAARLEARPELGFVMAHAVQFLEPGSQPPAWLTEEWLAGVRAPAGSLAHASGRGSTASIPAPRTLLARRHVFDLVGGFAEDMKIGEDIDWLMRAVDAGVRHELLPDVVLHQRLHSANTSYRLAEATAARLRVARRSAARKRSAIPEPTVSVVVPVLNGEPFLGEAISSALAQTHPPLEVVVVDDGSIDGSAAVAASLGVRVVQQPHRGVSAARNTGIAVAGGDLVALLDADDRWPLERLAVGVERMRVRPELGFVLGRARLFLEPGTARPEWFTDELLEGSGALALGTILARRELFESVGGFDESTHICEDLEWLARARDLGITYELLDDVVLEYRVHGANTGLPRRRELQQGALRTLRSSVRRKRRRDGLAMGERPLVTVVIPAFEAEALLPEALESVLAQDYERREVIVVDDGSTDGTPAVASRYPVKCVRQPNRGLAAARNAGVTAGEGSLVAFLDADDLWLPGKLSAEVAYLVAHPELGYVLSRMQRVLMPGAPWPPGTPAEWFEEPQPGTLPSSGLVRRSVLEAVGPFDSRFRAGPDTEWHARATDAGVRWEMLPEVLVHYRIHGANMSYDNLLMKREMFDLLRASLARKRVAR